MHKKRIQTILIFTQRMQVSTTAINTHHHHHLSAAVKSGKKPEGMSDMLWQRLQVPRPHRVLTFDSVSTLFDPF